jgi:disulfide oxidoreductase YuzD
MDIDGRKAEKTPDYIRPPSYTDDGKSMDWSLCKMRKGTPNEIFRAEFQELVNEKYNDHTRIYIDGSKKKEEVGYAVVTVQQSTRKRIKDQSSIISAEQKPIKGAIHKLSTTGVRRVIFTDYKHTVKNLRIDSIYFTYTYRAIEFFRLILYFKKR